MSEAGNLANASGPNVGPWLTDRLRVWGITTLTDVQARALNAGIADGCGMIVSAPTSSGKTLVGEIAVLSALRAGVRAIGPSEEPLVGRRWFCRRRRRLAGLRRRRPETRKG